MKLLFAVILFLLEIPAAGLVFFLALDYIEGRRVGKRKIRRMVLLPAGTVISLFSMLLLRGVAGFGTHPLGELAAAMFLAALAAAFCSAMALISQSLRKNRKKTPSRTACSISISHRLQQAS